MHYNPNKGVKKYNYLYNFYSQVTGKNQSPN